MSVLEEKELELNECSWTDVPAYMSLSRSPWRDQDVLAGTSHCALSVTKTQAPSPTLDISPEHNQWNEKQLLLSPKLTESEFPAELWLLTHL